MDLSKRPAVNIRRNEAAAHGAKIKLMLKKLLFNQIIVGKKSIDVIPGGRVRDLMFSDENIERYFRKAFIHSSYDPVVNYEKLETYGDLLSNVFAGNKIRTQFPNFEPKHISNMLAYYKSNYIFGQALKDHINDIDDLILKSPSIKLTVKTYGDIFEALMDAVSVVANSIVKGIGYQCAENVFILLTRNIKLDEKHARGNPKSLVQELFGAESTKEIPGKGEYDPEKGLQVKIKEENINLLNSQLTQAGSLIRIPIGLTDKLRESRYPPDKFGRSKYPLDRQTAVTEAYQWILDQLEDIGLTPEKYEDIKRDWMIKSHKLRDEINKRLIKYTETIALIKKDSDQPGALDWNLIATNKTTLDKKWLASITVSHDTTGFHKAKDALLNKYVNMERTPWITDDL